MHNKLNKTNNVTTYNNKYIYRKMLTLFTQKKGIDVLRKANNYEIQYYLVYFSIFSSFLPFLTIKNIHTKLVTYLLKWYRYCFYNA